MAKAPTYSPFTPLGPRAQRRRVKALVNAQILPLIAQINAEINRRQASGSAAISGYTSRLASDLAPLAGATHATYTGAEARQSADDAALADRLTRVGGDVGASLRAQLQLAGQSTAPADAAAQQGAAAGATVAGLGSAALANLRAHGAAAETFSGQLPGIARVGGQQRIAQLLGQMENERATQVGAVRAKVPELLASVGSDVANQEFQKAVAAQSGLLDQRKFNLDVAYKKATIGQRSRSNDIAQQRADQAAAKAQSDALFKKAGLNLARDRYQLAVTNEHRLERAKSGKTGGFTPTQVAHLRATAIESAKDYKHGIPATYYANGGIKTPAQPPHPGTTGARALFRALVNHGIPPTMADWATGEVYGRWHAPGEKGNRGAGGTGPR